MRAAETIEGDRQQVPTTPYLSSTQPPLSTELDSQHLFGTSIGSDRFRKEGLGRFERASMMKRLRCQGKSPLVANFFCLPLLSYLQQLSFRRNKAFWAVWACDVPMMAVP